MSDNRELLAKGFVKRCWRAVLNKFSSAASQKRAQPPLPDVRKEVVIAALLAGRPGQNLLLCIPKTSAATTS
jgi:hypothetical protein